MADDLAALAARLDAPERLPTWRAARVHALQGTVGDAKSCFSLGPGDPDRPLRSGGTPDAAERAARRLFTWESPASASSPPAVGGLLAEVPARHAQALCTVGLRVDIPSAIPAALAFSHDRFWTHDDKQAAFDGALMAIHAASWQRHHGAGPPDAWWAAAFGDLLVPFLNPRWSSPDAVKDLAHWAHTDATAWLHGRVDSPAWLAAPR